MATHTYNCSQQELYTIARSCWQACNQYITAFQQFSSLYTPAYIAAALAQVEAAQNLPSGKEKRRTTHLLLQQQASLCLSHWQLLKRYIKKAFPAGELSIRYDAAGAQHYRKASRRSWQHCTQLCNDAAAFISTHQAALLANNNMAPSFPATFNAAVAAYKDLLKEYHAAAQLGEIDTQTKILANNAVHRQLMQMLKDAELIFKKNPAVKNLFTFSQVLRTISPAIPHPA